MTYNASGVAKLHKSGAKLVVAPTTLRLRVRQDQTFTGEMRVKPTRTEFEDPYGSQAIFGLTAHFTQAGAGITGSYRKVHGGIAITGVARYFVRISNVTMRGPNDPPSEASTIPVGRRCSTTKPAVVPVSTPEGQVFDLTEGGVLTGTFTVPKLANCNRYDPSVNYLASGPGNSMRIKATDGQAQG